MMLMLHIIGWIIGGGGRGEEKNTRGREGGRGEEEGVRGRCEQAFGMNEGRGGEGERGRATRRTTTTSNNTAKRKKKPEHDRAPCLPNLYWRLTRSDTGERCRAEERVNRTAV